MGRMRAAQYAMPQCVWLGGSIASRMCAGAGLPSANMPLRAIMDQSDKWDAGLGCLGAGSRSERCGAGCGFEPDSRFE